MTRIDKWQKLLKENGYSVEYGSFLYWHDVEIAVKDGIKTPLAYTGSKNGQTYIIRLKDIVANDFNFNCLLNRNSDSCPPFSAKLVKKLNNYTFLSLEK